MVPVDQNVKIQENRLRRAAERQGLMLQKSRQRDPRGMLYGTYQLVDISTNALVWADFTMQSGYGLSLKDVEDYLDGTVAKESAGSAD